MNATRPASLVVLALAAALAAAPAAAEEDGKRPAPAKGGEKAADAPGAPSKADVEKALQEAFTKADRNGDGTLRGAELPAGWAERYDRDGDGDVSRTEYTEVTTRPEKLRRVHRMRDLRARAASTMAAFDRNKDGAVQREEYPGREDVFRRTDRNRDGALQPAEVTALCEDELAEIRKQMKSPERNEFLTLFDVDGDQKVGFADEYDGPAAAFRKFDTDGDGVVTYDELYPERMRAARDAGPRPEQTSALQALDKDGDGKVARAEFAGSDAAWRRLDTNGDGWLTTADR